MEELFRIFTVFSKHTNTTERIIYANHLFSYYYLIREAIGTAATPGLLCQPWVIVNMIVEKQMECRLAGETKVLIENLAQCHFCPSQNPTLPDLDLNPGHSGGKPATNRLRYGAAPCKPFSKYII
jgi:hypothetical protein